MLWFIFLRLHVVISLKSHPWTAAKSFHSLQLHAVEILLCRKALDSLWKKTSVELSRKQRNHGCDCARELLRGKTKKPKPHRNSLETTKLLSWRSQDQTSIRSRICGWTWDALFTQLQQFGKENGGKTCRHASWDKATAAKKCLHLILTRSGWIMQSIVLFYPWS